ncbi:MAG: glycosyltransferase N-terminal domain-containing protein [Niabella sp.]
MIFFYNLFIRLYRAGIWIAAMFNAKARQWGEGRRAIFDRLSASFEGNDAPVLWMHCASLGEFEQGRPVLESFRKERPGYKILLTFFSPSGYEVRKNYGGADWVYYLPLDTRKNVRRFMDIVRPNLCVFVKYEYWYHYLHTLYERQVPTILISAIFRENAVFFKSYGGLQRRMVNFFSRVFVQDEESKGRLSHIFPDEKITVAGDTRYDRVMEIAGQFKPIPAIEQFLNGRRALVAGSTWPEDEKVLSKFIESTSFDISLIIAPHEIHESHINFLLSLFPDATQFSDWEKSVQNGDGLSAGKVLIINNIGMLSRLYHYATISYIGGGFNKSGIHNTLEAAVYGRPVVFGPEYQKFAEAKLLIKNLGGYSYNNDNQFFDILNTLLTDETLRLKSGMAAGNQVKENAGATDKIMKYILEEAIV